MRTLNIFVGEASNAILEEKMLREPRLTAENQNLLCGGTDAKGDYREPRAIPKK